MDDEECLPQEEELPDAVRLDDDRGGASSAANRPKKLPRLELQANSLEDYNLLLGGGAECEDADEDSAEEAQDANQEAIREDARSRG